MRTLSTLQEICRGLHGKSVAWVIEIDLPYPAETVRLSNRVITIGGSVYQDKILSFGDATKVIPAGVDLRDALGSASGFDFTVRSLPEDADRFSELLEATVCDGCRVRFGCVFIPAGYAVEESDIIWLHTYAIDSYTIRTETVLVRCVDYAGTFGNTKMLLEVKDADWPRAPHDSYGKIVPQIYGKCTDCPLIPVDIGARTNTDGHIEVTDRIIAVDDVSEFADPPAGVGAFIEIEGEIIHYFEIDRVYNNFGTASKLCDRACQGTAAVEHADGVTVYEVRATYDYLVADHPCNAVENVRVGGDTPVVADGYELEEVSVGGRWMQLLKMLSRPMAKRWQSGGQTLRLEGQKAPIVTSEGPDSEWYFDTVDANADTLNCLTPDEVTQFTKLTRDRQIIGFSVGGRLGEIGLAKYGRFKKLRLGIEYQASNVWNGNTWPYWSVTLRDNLLANTNGGIKRPDLVDNSLVVEAHDHQEQSDWTIAPTTPLFETKTETDHCRFNFDLSSGNQNTPPGTFFENFVFDGLEKIDGSYVIDKIRLRVSFDGYATSCTIKITLPNGQSRLINIPANSPVTLDGLTHYVISGLYTLEIDVKDVGPILFSDIWNGTASGISFRVDGKLLSGYWAGIDFQELTELEVDSHLYIKGQDADLGQTKDKNKTSTEEPGGETSTSRVIQYCDMTYFAEYWGDEIKQNRGWGFFSAGPEIELSFCNDKMDDDTEIYIYRLWLEVEYQPFTTEIADDLIADVSGKNWVTTLMENPVDVLQSLLGNYAGVPAELIDDESFDSARVAVAAYCPKVARHVGEQTTARELIQTLLTNTNMRLVFEGLKYYLRLRDWNYDQADSVGEITNIYFAEKGLEKVRSGTDALFNQLAIYYNRSPLNGGFRRVRESNDLTSQGMPWGIRRETYDGLWIAEDNNAIQWLGYSLLAFGGWKYVVVKLTLPLHWIHLELGDIVELTHERSGLDHNLGEVVMTRRAGDDRIQIGVAIWDAVKLFSAAGARVEADRGGKWMRFYVDSRLTAILDVNGNFTVRGRALAGAGSYINGYSGNGETSDYFLCEENSNPPGHHLSVHVNHGDQMLLPLILWGGPLDRSHYPYASYPEWGARLYGTSFKFNQAFGETVEDYVTHEDGRTLISTNRHDVAAIYEYIAFGEDGYPGGWQFKGKLKSNGIK